MVSLLWVQIMMMQTRPEIDKKNQAEFFDWLISNKFEGVPTQSHYELRRFVRKESGHIVIVFTRETPTGSNPLNTHGLFWFHKWRKLMNIDSGGGDVI